MKKDELLEKAALLGLNVDPKSKMAEIKAVIDEAEKAQEPEPSEPSGQVEPAGEVEPPVEKSAKAGRHSKKGVEEAEDRAEKIARQKGELAPEDKSETSKPKPKAQPKARSRLERRGKNYRKAHEKIEKGREYGLDEAMPLIQQTSTVKFDASVELHLNLGVDPRQADQNIRGTVVLPHGTGKSVRVAVFGSEDDAAAAKKAGADLAGSEDFLEQLKKGETDFDILIATPETMGKLAAFAKLLGPKGLMPNPKSGTVTNEVARAVKEAKAGRVEFRVDKQGIIHAAVGKVSFKPEELVANARALVKAVKDARPTSVKGVYLISAALTTTMGPSVRLDLKSL
jgi:large subunit ribosomal protein L1